MALCTAFYFALVAAAGLLVGNLVRVVDAQVTRYIYHASFENDTELAAPTAQRTWAVGASSILACGNVCNSDLNCTGYSYAEDLATKMAVCKIGAIANNTRAATGSQVFYKVEVDKDGWATYFNAFSYKLFLEPTSSPLHARGLCIENGGLLPVGYPSNNADSTLKAFMMTMSPDVDIFVGVELTNASAVNGTILFTTHRDWPIYVEPGKPNPKQPWATNQPQIPAFSKPSDVAVIKNREGWFTVNVASGQYLTNVLVCMKHTTYEIWSGTNRFYKFSNATASWFGARDACRAEGGDLARSFGEIGAELISFAYAKRGLNGAWYSGIELRAGGMWSFSDGTVLNDNNRLADSRQIWYSNLKGAASLTEDYCIREWRLKWGGDTCLRTDLPRTCEGLF